MPFQLKTELHKLVDTGKGKIREWIILLILSPLLALVYYFRDHILILLKASLTKPIINWQTQEVATFAILFLLVCAFFYFLGHIIHPSKKQNGTNVPSETFKIVPWRSHGLWFDVTEPNDKENNYHLESHFWITNIHSAPMQIVQCDLLTYFAVSSFEIRQDFQFAPYRPGLKLDPQQTFLVHTKFLVYNMKVEPNVDIVSDLVFIDNYGNKHLLKDYHFYYYSKNMVAPKT